MTEDQLFLSVTTAIGMLDKPGLLYWAAQEAARAAVNEQGTWRALLDSEGRDEAIKWLSGARFRKGGHDLAAAQLGTAVHEACEITVRDRQRPRRLHPEVAPFIDQFEDWLAAAQPTFVGTEMTVYDSKHHYAGQTDGILELDGKRWLFDYKSTRRAHDKRGKRTMPYQEVALQMAAYENAEMTINDAEPRRDSVARTRVYRYGEREKQLAEPIPKVDGCLAIHITPEHCNAHPVRTGQRIYQAFLALLTVAYVSREELKDAVSKPIMFAPIPRTPGDEE